MLSVAKKGDEDMNVNCYLQIAPLINDCPNCGNGFVGNGQGTLNVEDNIIRRTCKCGFKFEHDVKKGVDIKLISKNIQQLVADFRNR